MLLTDLGWTSERDRELGAVAEEGSVPARVSLEHNHVYRVLTESGELLAETAGRIKHLAGARSELPAVGDWVAVRPNQSGHAVIRAILPRRTWFSRKAAGRETEEQVIAANIDTVLIVFGLDTHVKPRAIERYLALARRAGVRPVVVLNKADLPEDVAADVADASVVAGDAPVHAVSAKDESRVTPLLEYLVPGQTVAFLGPSGVGKSSLVNLLMGEAVLATGPVRERDNRGRHTSVHRQLLLRPGGGLIIDTPGMRELQLWDVDESLDETFGDILELSPACRFRDCRHESEPGCAIKAAVESGTLAADRYESYLQLRAEHASVEKKRDERSEIDAKRQARLGSKAYKAMQKLRGR
jgi:ribosome biogenesis GTPase / thiamine phosphate phosphatase